ncbi:MAG: hypothetical protein WC997_11515 [Porticoccaceae bacterium]
MQTADILNPAITDLLNFLALEEITNVPTCGIVPAARNSGITTIRRMNLTWISET